MVGEQIPSCHHSDRKKEKTEEKAKEIKKQSQKKQRLARSCRQRRLSLGGQFGIGAYQGGGLCFGVASAPPWTTSPGERKQNGRRRALQTEGQAAQPRKEALEMLTVMSARTVRVAKKNVHANLSKEM